MRSSPAFFNADTGIFDPEFDGLFCNAPAQDDLSRRGKFCRAPRMLSDELRRELPASPKVLSLRKKRRAAR
jgi:hypothetical protein